MSASKIIFDSDDILKVISVDSHGNQLNIHFQGKQKTGRCPNCLCSLRIFTERFDYHFKAYKRTTERLEKKLLNIALEAGGKPAERISRQFSISVSDTTLLRMISKVSLPN